ncbi:MAG: hypothetical protein BGO55_27455 [Sphingobacteriales bacterium 50-39]|nr:hypothetical protein [Sphingobacteriales bacterium]OJW56783.1 MAG: hypothetical protein BGO55_27455 [Sphingobacteriales bacterium 50-39]
MGKYRVFIFLLLFPFAYCFSQNKESITIATDKKDVKDTTVTLLSHGEGCMDKDSLPFGKWMFYCKDENGKEYLFKEGFFKKTIPGLFDIIGDTVEIRGLFGVQNSPDSLKLKQLTFVKYIKCGTWVYYHPNGKIWKKVNFRCDKLPVKCDIAHTDNGSMELLVSMNENFGQDEYVDGAVSEFDEEGYVFKKVIFSVLNRVIYKAVYDKRGSIIKVSRAFLADGNRLLPNNY